MVAVAWVSAARRLERETDYELDYKVEEAGELVLHHPPLLLLAASVVVVEQDELEVKGPAISIFPTATVVITTIVAVVAMPTVVVPRLLPDPDPEEEEEEEELGSVSPVDLD